MNRRAAVRALLTGLATAMTCRAVGAATDNNLGNGACTKCKCDAYQSSLNKVCSNPYCKHPYDAHKRIHPPTACDQNEEAVAAETFCVTYTYYKKVKGVVTKITSGRVGPYSTRLEAQSRVDEYNANDQTVNGVRYFYEARVTNCKP